MKPLEICASFSVEFYAQLPDDHGLVAGAAQMFHSRVADEVYLAQAGRSVRARIANRKACHELLRHLERGGARLVFISTTSQPDRMHGRAHFFFGEELEMGELDIVLDDDSLQAAKGQGVVGTPQGLGSMLSKACTVEADGPRFMLMALEGAGGQQHTWESGFYLLAPGRKIMIVAQHTEEGQIWRARRFLVDPGTRNPRAIRLASGQLRFTDRSNAAVAQRCAALAMQKLAQDGSGYLRMWDRYGHQEGRQLLEHAREVGALRLKPGGEAVSGGMRFYFDEPAAKPGLVAGDLVHLVDQLPVYLEDPNMDWEAYRADVTSRLHHQRERGGPHTEQGAPLKVLEVTEHGITLQHAPTQQPGLLVVLSLGGDEAQIDRRELAREKVLQGTGGMPYLGMIIEENGRPPRPVEPKKLAALTPFVRDKVFRKPPTEVQEEAIRIALNTPDIAVIQGPPGTGKTTVITAIIERLNEEQERSEAARGAILVSGFQHDAVENIVSRLSVNALPAVKFGRRAGQDNDASAENRRNWSLSMIDRIRKQTPAMRQSEQLLALRQRGRNYLLEPSRSAARALLRNITALPAHLLGSESVAQAQRLLASLDEPQDASASVQLPARLRVLYALRVSEAGFRDDGPASVARLLQAFEDDIDEADLPLLDRAMCWREPDPLEFLPGLRSLKAQLLDRAVPAPVFQVEKPRSDILELLATVQRQVAGAERRFEDPTLTVLAGFVHELEWNPAALDEALADYSYVYAATCQGAVGKDIVRKKKGNAGSELDNLYSTVIIDEAARCSPRDLLIPMVLAQRRIILVGDQRQLPHLIDEQLVRKLDQGLVATEPDNAGDYRRSLFDYLLARLKKLKQSDGFDRTITLDAQYRMHPLLGEFVSDHFYKPHGESFGSPRPAADFKHELLAGTLRPTAPLAWLQVPTSEGRECPDGSKSLYRTSEAKAIAYQLKRWIDSTAGQGLSFGVISFYKAQVNELHNALAAQGLSQRGPGGEWGIADGYRYLHEDDPVKREERLRVGTVDAFQGMEFDVVFLSMVRTPSTRKIKPEASLEERHAASFGRLVLENLRCVALSRQKRLLVMVGDPQLLEGPLAGTALPDLIALRDLCRNEGVEL
ncbi:AAA domain-containing protein [Pseudomonas sp. 8209]|uniref:DEAD/DEAH box helicase n=1 Tax=Pseudomonas sp. 8209 TaxID=2967214 RepID=UPI002364791A|nr:AAA domain-containing protein [Pseudomonas sp. 8209]MDD1956906.1 AAA domain-containing protein [Pseudomonas sp. 8209]